MYHSVPSAPPAVLPRSDCCEGITHRCHGSGFLPRRRSIPITTSSVADRQVREPALATILSEIFVIGLYTLARLVVSLRNRVGFVLGVQLSLSRRVGSQIITGLFSPIKEPTERVFGFASSVLQVYSNAVGACWVAEGGISFTRLLARATGIAAEIRCISLLALLRRQPIVLARQVRESVSLAPQCLLL